MFKPIIRLLAFFGKEFNEVRRQPRLVLSMLLGPFLILMLFGVGYQRNQPLLRTALVIPSEGVADVDPETLRKAGNSMFAVVDVSPDRDQMLAKLRNREVDVVQIFPSDVKNRVLQGQQGVVDFQYNEINPITEAWIQYLAYAEVVEINRAILLRTVTEFQAESKTTNAQLQDIRQQLQDLETDSSKVDSQRLQASLRQAKQASAVVASSSLLMQGGTADQDAARKDFTQLQGDLDTLDQAISAGKLDQQRDRIRTTRERVQRMEEATKTAASLPPEVIIAPLVQKSENITGASYNVMIFYAPGVLALLIQHIAVTLAALSLVRERVLGALEIFRVAPVGAGHMLIGKYLSYTVFIAIITAILVGLLRLLGIPFLGDIRTFAEVALLLTLASLGIGFVISALSRSDSQAVQLSMLVLLLSIFFSGFFLELRNFWAPVGAIGYALPITHGISGFQSVLLRGLPPDNFTWIGLGAITGVTFLAALILTARQFQKP